MALQIWTTNWMKVSTRHTQKLICLPHSPYSHVCRSLSLHKDYRLSVHHAKANTLCRNGDGDVTSSAFITSNRNCERRNLNCLYESSSSYHSSSAYCSGHNSDKNICDTDKLPDSDVTATLECLDVTNSLAKQTGSYSQLDHDSDSEDINIKPSLDSITPSVPPPMHVDMVPGKGPPPEPPLDCCMSGCANCVWIQYAEELKQYFSNDTGLERVKQDIETIDNPGLKMFLKLELGLL